MMTYDGESIVNDGYHSGGRAHGEPCVANDCRIRLTPDGYTLRGYRAAAFVRFHQPERSKILQTCTNDRITGQCNLILLPTCNFNTADLWLHF